MRILLDTNVLLSAFGAHGLCEALVAACLEGHEIVASAHLLAELRRNLVRKFRMPERTSDEIVAFVREHATIVVPVEVPHGACPDQDDLPVLGTAIAGAVDMLVTGDGELLALGRWEGIPIVGPRECYERLR